MPVEDHPVHERTKIDADFRYGCNSRKEFKRFYMAPDRKYFGDGRFTVGNVKVPHKMTTTCQSVELWDTDPGCRGCNRRGKK